MLYFFWSSKHRAAWIYENTEKYHCRAETPNLYMLSLKQRLMYPVMLCRKWKQGDRRRQIKERQFKAPFPPPLLLDVTQRKVACVLCCQLKIVKAFSLSACSRWKQNGGKNGEVICPLACRLYLTTEASGHSCIRPCTLS